MPDSKVVGKILRSLPKRFYHKVVAIEECQNLSKMKIEELVGLIQTFKLKLKPIKESIALKSTKENFSMDENDNENIVLFIKKIKNVLKM